MTPCQQMPVDVSWNGGMAGGIVPDTNSLWTGSGPGDRTSRSARNQRFPGIGARLAEPDHKFKLSLHKTTTVYSLSIISPVPHNHPN
jgi:hypothetical protein